MDWIFWTWIRATSKRIRSEVFFAVAGADLDFVFAEKTLLVVGLTYIYPESNRIRLFVSTWFRCQAKFLTSRHVRMHRVIFYISNTLRKLMIRA